MSSRWSADLIQVPGLDPVNPVPAAVCRALANGKLLSSLGLETRFLWPALWLANYRYLWGEKEMKMILDPVHMLGFSCTQG